MRIIIPPKPLGKMMFGELPTYEASGLWMAQRKFNGDHIVIRIAEDDVAVYGRSGSSLSRFQPTIDLINQIKSLDLPKGENWIDGELLSNHTTNKLYKRKLVLYDLLMENGKYLFGSPTCMDRWNILNNWCRKPKILEPGRGIALQVTPDVWLAEVFTTDFRNRFDEMLDMPEIEGLVLKKKASAHTDLGTKPDYEVKWMIRCRKAHPGGNYQF